MSAATELREPTVNQQLAREHGLSDDEWERILAILGRTPTFSELRARSRSATASR
jgi:hypothetical protein